MSWSCVRELTRVATPETESTWLAGARGRTVREVEKLVSGHRLGNLPDEPAEPSAERHVLRFEVSGEVLATFRAAMTKIRTEAGGPLDDDAALLLLARQVLAGPSDDGRASYQLELSVCEQCQRTQQVAQGELVEVSAEVAAMVRCDAQQLASPHVGLASPHVGKASEARAHGRIICHSDARFGPGNQGGRFNDFFGSSLSHNEPTATCFWLGRPVSRSLRRRPAGRLGARGERSLRGER